MIQLNLLPDVKLDYLRAQRASRLVMAVAVLTSAASIVLLASLLVVGGFQKKYLGDLNRDISKETAQLKAKPDINKILTVQNQLGSLTALHDGKPATTRLFGYLNQITPTDSGIASLKIDFVTYAITIDGGSDSLSSVNKYVDTLKYTKYSVDKSDTFAPAFSSVVLKSFGLNSESSANTRPASFSITLTYDPVIFDIAKNVELHVPSQVTTRASLEKAADLFQSAPKTPLVPGGGN